LLHDPSHTIKTFLSTAVAALTVLLLGSAASPGAESKHNLSSQYPTYEGRVMCGYQ
jgi:hypothetical protein